MEGGIATFLITPHTTANTLWYAGYFTRLLRRDFISWTFSVKSRATPLINSSSWVMAEPNFTNSIVVETWSALGTNKKYIYIVANDRVARVSGGRVGCTKYI